MLFFLFNSYNFVLIAAAVIPALILLRRIYKLDRLEKESKSFVWRLVWGGVLATFTALILELIGGKLLNAWCTTQAEYNFWEYFLVVAGAEEGSKYYFLKRRSWSSEEFNCQYDAVVYSTAVALGFALWENINYVFQFGMATALVRAVTAVPGHCCFGVFMGAFYGMAKRYDNYGYPRKSKRCRRLAVLLPMLLHGAYDFIATQEETGGGAGLFLIFVIIMFLFTFRLVRKLSDHDRYIA